MQDAGEKDAANSSFNECLAQYQDGKVAMWYDATVAAGLLEADDSPVKGKNGYALAPVDKTKASGWLWSWALAIPKSSPDADRRLEVHRVGDRPAYIKAAGTKTKGGWASIPPGTRHSTYQIPQYKKAAAAFAAKTLDAMKAAPINNPGTTKRPGLPGVQYVGIPQFQDVGNRCTQLFSSVIAGSTNDDYARSASASRSRRTRSSSTSDVTAADATTRRGRSEIRSPLPWRRRLPLLPALIFTIVVTQLPFLVSIYYSFTDLKDRTQSLIPEPTKFVGHRQLQGDLQRPVLPGGGVDEREDDRPRRRPVARLRNAVRDPARPQVPRAGVRANAADHAVSADAGRGGADLEAADVLVALRGPQQGARVLRSRTRWRSSRDHPLASIVTVLVWQWTPFMMLIMLAGLQSQPSDILEAARVDGATPFGIFRQLTLPHLRRYMELGVLLGSIYIDPGVRRDRP